jgi:hypothetical protein
MHEHYAVITTRISPLNAELNPICHLLALLGGATIVVVSRLRVKTIFDLTSLILFLVSVFHRLIFLHTHVLYYFKYVVQHLSKSHDNRIWTKNKQDILIHKEVIRQIYYFKFIIFSEFWTRKMSGIFLIMTNVNWKTWSQCVSVNKGNLILYLLI